MYYVCFQMYVSPSRPPYILSRFQKKKWNNICTHFIFIFIWHHLHFECTEFMNASEEGRKTLKPEYSHEDNGFMHNPPRRRTSKKPSKSYCHQRKPSLDTTTTSRVDIMSFITKKWWQIFCTVCLILAGWCTLCIFSCINLEKAFYEDSTGLAGWHSNRSIAELQMNISCHYLCGHWLPDVFCSSLFSSYSYMNRWKTICRKFFIFHFSELKTIKHLVILLSSP